MKARITIALDIQPCGDDDIKHQDGINLTELEPHIREQIAYVIQNVHHDGAFSSNLPISAELEAFTIDLIPDAAHQGPWRILYERKLLEQVAPDGEPAGYASRHAMYVQSEQDAVALIERWGRAYPERYAYRILERTAAKDSDLDEITWLKSDHMPGVFYWRSQLTFNEQTRVYP